MSSDIHQFDDAKYINLDTYKKSGKSVTTPVWFVIEDDVFFVLTREVLERLNDYDIIQMLG